MICFFGGRAGLWPPLHELADRLTPRPPELLAILSRTLGDPAHLTPAMLARADTSVAGLDRQVSPARIIRTGIAVAHLDRLSHCCEPLQRAIQHGGAVTSAIEALFLLAQDAFHPGRWEEARRMADEGLHLCDVHGYRLLAWPGRLTVALLLSAARGDSRTATRMARDMDAWAGPRRAGIVGAYASHVRSLTALGQADFETAFANAAAISPPGTLAPYAPHALWVLLDLVEAAIHTGRRTEAAAHVAAARDRRLDRLSPRLRLVVLACVAITEPRTDFAVLEQAITDPGDDRWPFDLARIQLTYGSHLRRVKRTTEARRRLADAAEGHTNKEIAARLLLSPRTVSTHLYQVFPKLGITSRAALRDARRRSCGRVVHSARCLPHRSRGTGRQARRFRFARPASQEEGLPGDFWPTCRARYADPKPPPKLSTSASVCPNRACSRLPMCAAPSRRRGGRARAGAAGCRRCRSGP